MEGQKVTGHFLGLSPEETRKERDAILHDIELLQDGDREQSAVTMQLHLVMFDEITRLLNRNTDPHVVESAILDYATRLARAIAEARARRLLFNLFGVTFGDETTCAHCGSDFGPDDNVVHTDNDGSYHSLCYEEKRAEADAE